MKTAYGFNLAAITRCLMLAKLNGIDPITTAEKEYRAGKTFEDMMTKAAVPGLDRSSAAYSAFTVSAEFAAAVRARTVVGKLPTTSAPFATPLPFISTGTEFGFVGELVPISAAAPTFGTNVFLDRLKVAGIVVVSNELLKSAKAESVLTRDMSAGLVVGTDRAFLDPARAGVVRTSPASITHGRSTFSASGATTIAEIDGVIADLIAIVAAGGSDMTGAAFVIDTSIATALASMRGSGGQLAYPTVSVNGGTLSGVKLVVSASSPADQITLIDGAEVLLAEDSSVIVSTSQAAMIDQSSSPAGNTKTSMFQEESSAIKILQHVNWSVRNPDGVAYATDFAPPAATFIGASP